MCEENRGNKNLIEIAEEHMEGDVVVRCRNVFEDHNSEGFKSYCREFKKMLNTYWENADESIENTY